MGTLEIRDDAIWIKHIRGDETLQARLHSLSQNQTIRLEVAGIPGEWAKMRDGKDGRTTPGIRPQGEMAKVWKSMQERRGQTVKIRLLSTADDYLESVQEMLDEWSSPEDETAYRDL